MNNRGQVTLFIIISILIVVSIIAVFFLLNRPSTEPSVDLTPQGQIEGCVKDAVRLSVEKVLLGGGKIEPKNYILYNGFKQNYLCYQQNYYITCVNQYPSLTKTIELEIKIDTLDEVEGCFEDLKEDMEGMGYSIVEGALNYNVKLGSEAIDIEVEKNIELKRGESTQTISDFGFSFNSPIYDLGLVAYEIVNQESQYCNFDYNGFMIIYPKYDIKKINYDGSDIYRIIDRKSGKEFKFAVRGCAIPPGL